MKTVSFRELVSLWECCFPCNEARLLFRPRGEGQGAGPGEGGGDRCGNPAERPGAARCPSRPVELAGTRAHARCGDAETARGNAWPLPASRAGGRGAAWHGTRAGARWQQAGKSSGGPRAGPAGPRSRRASGRRRRLGWPGADGVAGARSSPAGRRRGGRRRPPAPRVRPRGAHLRSPTGDAESSSAADSRPALASAGAVAQQRAGTARGRGAGRETRRGRRATWRSPRGGVARGACSAVSPQRTSFCSVRRVP